MKKIILAAAAVVLTVSSVVPYMTFSENTDIPRFYMSLNENSGFSVENDGTIALSMEQAADGITLPIDVYYSDTTLTTYNVKARWGTSSDKIKIENIRNAKSDPDTKFAYKVTTSYDFLEEKNVVYSVCDNFMNTNPLNLTGTASDDYPLISFDIKLAEDIPEGYYEVCFLKGDDSCRATLKLPEGWTIYSDDEDISPITENLKIKIGDPPPTEPPTELPTTATQPTTTSTNTTTTTTITQKPATTSTTITEKPTTTAKPTTKPVLIGDVNNDGTVDSSDASDVLIEYAKLQTGRPASFNDTQKKAADVNNDDKIDSSDASRILIYYSESSTGKKPSWN